jgi:hypothetical protein
MDVNVAMDAWLDVIDFIHLIAMRDPNWSFDDFRLRINTAHDHLRNARYASRWTRYRDNIHLTRHEFTCLNCSRFAVENLLRALRDLIIRMETTPA